jgi:hypothetical protein
VISVTDPYGRILGFLDLQYYQYSQNRHDAQTQKTAVSFVIYYIVFVLETC